jgi:predicted RNase H-like nuclease (RuvC/YqgF family)
MENQIFDLLEQKIIQMLGVVSGLKSRNQELVEQNRELQAKLEEKERNILTLKEELDQRKRTQNDVDAYKEKQERIRFKIESLVEKLREFEDTP